MNQDRIRFNCTFPADLWTEIEKCADLHGITKTAVVTSAINEYLFESHNQIKSLRAELKKINDRLDVIMALLAKKSP